MSERADHTGYIRAVTEHTAEQDVRIEHVRTGTTDGLRWARLELHPEDTPRLQLHQDHIAILWDEERSWGWATVTGGRTGEILRQGQKLAPDPETVAEWIYAAMHIPHGAREDEPLRGRTDEAPELEKFLADFS